MANKEWIKKGADGLSFGERLEDLIKLNKTTATALAKDTGLSQSAISDYLNKDRAPDCATVCVLAQYFSVSTDYLLGRSDVSSLDLTVQDIHRKTGLTEENITSLMNRGPFGQQKLPFLVKGYEKLTNDLISYASTHLASRTYSRFLRNANSPEPPQPQSAKDCNHSIVNYKVVAEIISGIPEDGVDYAKGYTAISSSEYSRFLLEDFLHDLKAYLQNLYFNADTGGMDDGND